MASVAVNNTGQYSCKCLNVRIRAAAAHPNPPDQATDADYSQVYVGEDGILVAHPQVTLRSRTRGVHITGTSRCSRFISLTCLICETLVYRVHQVIPIEIEGKDGPMLPTDEWVEHEIMKSLSGWIEVHKSCLTGDAIARAESSPNYSAIFSLILPAGMSPVASPEPTPERPSSRDSPQPTSTSYLSNMRPLFPPAPFTPSHPVFIHLSSLAEKQSQALRASAEQYIAETVRAKVSEIEGAESELRRHVEVLWKQFRTGINQVEKERNQTVLVPGRSSSRSRERDTWPSAANGVASSSYGTPFAVRDFTPVSLNAVSPARPSNNSTQRSALSASLATSTFHHPRERSGQASSPPSARPLSSKSNGSNGSGSSHTLSSPSGSSTLAKSVSVEGNNVLQFRRNTDDAINTAASYKYFLNLEEDIARHKAANQKQQGTNETQVAGPSQLASNTDANGSKKPRKVAESQSSADDPETKKVDSDGRSISRGREKVSSKGKRKVTFDVQPAIVTIKREMNAEKEEEAALANQDAGEMIFDIEDEGSERSFSSRPTLPLLEQPSQSRPARPRKARTQHVGLPGSFSALRPESLPAPSSIRPARGHHGVDSSSQPMMLSLARPVARVEPRRSDAEPQQPQSPAPPASSEESVNPRDAVILKLVAADTPSHRGAWKPDSKAWQTFVRRQDSKEHSDGGNIPEEGDESGDNFLGLGPTEMARVSSPAMVDDDDEDDGEDDTVDRVGIVGSLPIPINPLSQPRETLSLASYQPKTSLADRPGILVPPLVQKPVSSTAIRRAAYAERDRSRSMDPGALDFATEEEDEEDEDEEDEDASRPDVPAESGGRGRKRALKILQARSEVPEAGMWRSLAS